MPVIFFDIGDTLATPIFSQEDRLEGFNVFPEARAALESLQSQGARMGIISNAGDEKPDTVNGALEKCGLLQFFDRDIIIYRKKDSPDVFVAAAAKANVPPDQCIFVGENSKERSFAMSAGFLRVSPHPLLTRDVVEGVALVYARITLADQEQVGRWEALRNSIQVVPLRVTGRGTQTILVISTIKALDSLRAAAIPVEVLGGRDAPLQTDLFLVRDDRATPPGFASAAEHSESFLAGQGADAFVLAGSAEGLYLAIPADKSIEEIHFPESQHGHNEKLIADLSLLNTVGGGANFAAEAAPHEAFAGHDLSENEAAALREITADVLRRHHEQYAGLASLEGDGPVASRHIRHPDNQRVVEALRRHLKTIGGDDVIVSRHRFQHENLFLHNVVAEFPGAEPSSLVLVTAHLDSTAASGGGPYNPATDPAPGSDDDASGVAAVLAIAETVARLRSAGPAKRTIRFVLFNAEEHGLVGSKAYARSQAAQQADITAVFQMDMIGFRGAQSAPPREFEVHAGFPPSAGVEGRSLALAQIIRESSGAVSPGLNAPQLYPDQSSGDEDPAAGRSDHAPFQERGYAACVVSEDFFAGPKADSPEAEPNPNYHKPTDRVIDYEYAADITRAVGAAALLVANS